jgi:hypothetical protein
MPPEGEQFVLGSGPSHGWRAPMPPEGEQFVLGSGPSHGWRAPMPPEGEQFVLGAALRTHDRSSSRSRMPR